MPVSLPHVQYIQQQLQRTQNKQTQTVKKSQNKQTTTTQQLTQQPAQQLTPFVTINPIITTLLASQLLAERGAERAYQQGLRSIFSQLRHRGLETSGIAQGAVANIASQFASQLADIRTQTARSLAEMQLRALENLMQLVASREAAALQAVAARAKSAKPLLETAQSQMQNIISALAGITALSPFTATQQTTSLLPPLSVNPDAWLSRPLI